MTNFLSFAFATSDAASVNRTLPDRLTDIRNVKDYGATGNGSTDDWAAIMAAYNNGQFTATATATTAGTTLTFGGGVPAGVVAGMYLNDVTNPPALTVLGISSQVLSTTSTTVTVDQVFATVTSGDVITFNIFNKGVIFFPPGSYIVSQPIDFSGANIQVSFFGVQGASTITGNFADYIFSRALNDSNGWSGTHTVEGLTVTNTHANGGGIRIGVCVGAAVRDCVITANQGIDTASDDLRSDGTTQEGSIENCTLSPGSNPTGSVGIMSVSDGPIVNCTITGYSVGTRLWGQQGGQTFIGCRFELCDIGFQPGVLPGGTGGTNTGASLNGCYFINCGRAILLDNSSANRIAGVKIESTNATVFGSTPQSGISGSSVKNSTFEGVYITGQFSNAGVDLSALNGSTIPSFAIYRGVLVNNTGTGVNWKAPTSANFAKLKSANVGFAYTLDNLPAFVLSVTSLTNSANVTTLTIPFNISGYVGSPMTVTIVGASPAGYNGFFTGAVATGVSTVQYSQTSPLGAGSGGVAVINFGPSALEGDCYNISDGTNGLTWGQPATNTGTHTTHYKVRWNGQSWTVMGK